MKLSDNFFISTGYQERQGDRLVARVCLNPSHFIYKSHFPDNPITPGVCIIQMATELLEQALGWELEIDVIHNVKFLSLLIPKEGEYIELSFHGGKTDDNHIKVKCNITDRDTIVSSLSITYTVHE